MLRLFERIAQRPRAMRSAPRDGRRIEGLFANEVWQEVYWDPFAREGASAIR